MRVMDHNAHHAGTSGDRAARQAHAGRTGPGRER